MRSFLVAVALLTVAARGGCGNGSSAPYQPCAGKACGAECSYDPPCLHSDPPCAVPSYVGQCDPKGTCQPPGTPNTCGPMAVCDGKACGAPCNPCAPAACISPVAYVCDLAYQCVPNAPDLCAASPAGCTYDGKTYQSGDWWYPYSNNCNTCSCNNGVVACTSLPMPYSTSCSGTWYHGCGDVLCGAVGTPNSYVPLCTTQKAGDMCTTLGDNCNLGDYCNTLLVCATSDPIPSVGCPISRAKYKTDIQYLDGADLDRVRAEVLKMRLATYHYRVSGPGAPQQLGFIIDDVGGGPSVNADGETVNLYGYTSMAVAALQAQERELAALREEVASLRRQVESKRAHKCSR